MLVGIHKECVIGYTRYMQRFEAILDYNSIEHVRLDINQKNFWEKLSDLDLFIYWWRQIGNERQIALTILPIIEKEMGISCLPNMSTCWLYDDKIREYYLLKQRGFPIVQSWIFWDKKEALDWLNKASFPVVFKLKGGAGSTNVVLVKSESQGRRLVGRMFGRGMKSGAVGGAVYWKDFGLKKELRKRGGALLRRIRSRNMTPGWELHKNYVLFQKFLPKNDYDTRVNIIGDRAFAFRRFNRPGDFRSSGSGRINYDTSKIDMKFIEKAFEVSKAMSFQSMAYDSLYDENGNVAFCEVSYTYVDSAVYDCTGYWDSSLNWHEGHFWPQYCQLKDALKLPELKQPDLQWFAEKNL